MALIFLSLAASALVHGVPLRAPAARMSVHSPGESSALYVLLDRLLRRAERSPSVRALTSRWLTMAPDALAENALVIGRNVVGDFEQGAELLDAAEEFAGAPLSCRAYGALMRIGEADGRHAEVLALLGRMRASGVEPGQSMLLCAMHSCAAIADWGGVSRLFAEYAGTTGDAEALELIGDPAIVEQIKLELRADEAAERPTKLGQSDTDALRLALRAHCARGDSALVAATIERARELDLALDRASYQQLLALALARKSTAPLQLLRPSDLGASARDWVEPAFFSARSAAAGLPKADKELLAIGLSTAVLLALAVAALSGGGSGGGEEAAVAREFSNLIAF